MNGNAHTAAPGWLFVLPWSLRHTGGVNQVVKSLIAEFRRDGVYSVSLLSGSDGSLAETSPEPGSIKLHRLDFWSPVNHRLPVRGWISFVARLPHRCWAMRKIVRRQNIRVINPHFPDLGSLLFVILKTLHLFNGQLILSFHLSDVLGALSTAGVERKLWRMLLRGADRIVVVSNDLAANVLRLEPAIKGKLTVIHNGVDLALFRAAEESVGDTQGIPRQDKNILSVGAFIPRKGHEILIRAFAQVLIQMPDTHLVLVGGSGQEVEPIQQLIGSLSLGNHVTVLKDVPHESIPEFFRRAQLFVLASRQESFGLVITEAAAARVPVVCTRAEGLRELIRDGVTGRLVDVDDHAALGDAILHALREPDEAKKMALAFYEQVKGSMTWQHAYARYLQVAADFRPSSGRRSAATVMASDID